MKRVNIKIDGGDNFLDNIYPTNDNPISIKLYINGKLQGSVITTIPLPDALTNLRLGMDNRDSGTPYFKGLIIDIRLYDRVLSNEEIWDDYSKISKFYRENVNSSDNYEELNGLLNDILEKRDSLLYGEYFGKLFENGNYNQNLYWNLSAILTSSYRTPRTLEAYIIVPKDLTDRIGVIVGNYVDSHIVPTINFEITEGGYPRIYYISTDDVSNSLSTSTFDSNASEIFYDNKYNVQLTNQNNIPVPVHVVFTIDDSECCGKNNISFTSAVFDGSVLKEYSLNPYGISDINTSYLTFLKNKISNDVISKNNIFFYKTSSALKMYSKDADNTLYPINTPTPTNVDGISGTAFEPLLYNIFINKFLDYAISDIFKQTYIEGKSESANTPIANSEE